MQIIDIVKHIVIIILTNFYSHLAQKAVDGISLKRLNNADILVQSEG